MWVPTAEFRKTDDLVQRACDKLPRELIDKILADLVRTYNVRVVDLTSGHAVIYLADDPQPGFSTKTKLLEGIAPNRYPQDATIQTTARDLDAALEFMAEYLLKNPNGYCNVTPPHRGYPRKAAGAALVPFMPAILMQHCDVVAHSIHTRHSMLSHHRAIRHITIPIGLTDIDIGIGNRLDNLKNNMLALKQALPLLESLRIETDSGRYCAHISRRGYPLLSDTKEQKMEKALKPLIEALRQVNVAEKVVYVEDRCHQARDVRPCFSVVGWKDEEAAHEVAWYYEGYDVSV